MESATTITGSTVSPLSTASPRPHPAPPADCLGRQRQLSPGAPLRSHLADVRGVRRPGLLEVSCTPSPLTSPAPTVVIRASAPAARQEGLSQCSGRAYCTASAQPKTPTADTLCRNRRLNPALPGLVQGSAAPTFPHQQSSDWAAAPASPQQRAAQPGATRGEGLRITPTRLTSWTHR